MEKTLFSVENTMVDYVAYVEEGIISKYSLIKGSFNHLDEEIVKEVSNDVSKVERHPGGSAASTLHGFCNLGGKALFCGSIGNDEVGNFYRNELEKSGIETVMAEKEGPNGVCYALVTPDKERTFAVASGQSANLLKKDIPLERMRKCWMLHTTAYALDHPEDTVGKAMDEAWKNDMGISFDLASVLSIQRHQSYMENIIQKYCSIVLANEDEAEAFTGNARHHESALELSALCKGISIVKLGSKGSLIAYNNLVQKVEPFKAKVVNTIGAGDGFTAGLLYGLAKGRKPEDAARIGSYYASKVVQEEGTMLSYRPKVERR